LKLIEIKRLKNQKIGRKWKLIEIHGNGLKLIEIKKFMEIDVVKLREIQEFIETGCYNEFLERRSGAGPLRRKVSKFQSHFDKFR